MREYACVYFLPVLQRPVLPLITTCSQHTGHDLVGDPSTVLGRTKENCPRKIAEQKNEHSEGIGQEEGVGGGGIDGRRRRGKEA